MFLDLTSEVAYTCREADGAVFTNYTGLRSSLARPLSFD